MAINISKGGAEVHHKINQLPTLSKENVSDAVRTRNRSTVQTTADVKQAQLKGESVSISDAQLIKAIEHAIKAVQGPSTSLDFSVHKLTKQIMIKVLNNETGDVIREIPPEKSLDFLAKLWEMAGILVDEKR